MRLAVCGHVLQQEFSRWELFSGTANRRMNKDKY